VEKFEAEGGEMKWNASQQGMAQLVIAGVPEAAKKLAEQTRNGWSNLAIFGEQLEYAIKNDNLDDARRLARDVYEADVGDEIDRDGCVVA
tara:strand:- start:1707 stop:1976 length:270 start_codon:yes stop_codon:yes gene_type:complete